MSSVCFFLASVYVEKALKRELIVFSFTWDHSEFKVWVVMKSVPYHGVLVKEYVGEILKSFDKFQVVPSSMKVLVPSSMKVFTTNLNGPLSPTVSRLSEGRAGRDTVGIS